MERRCNVYCVARVAYAALLSGGQKVKGPDGPGGVIGVNCKRMGLRIETTARQTGQTAFVAEAI